VVYGHDSAVGQLNGRNVYQGIRYLGQRLGTSSTILRRCHLCLLAQLPNQN
jgi:hypothetical protein